MPVATYNQIMSAYNPSQGWYKPPAPQPRPVQTANVRDDYERWYTEQGPHNRMLLALRSGIVSEISWALDRLCRLSENEQFLLNSIPGLTDALLEWPQWYVTEGYQEGTEFDLLFSPSPAQERKRRNALESMFILRNCTFLDVNAEVVARNPATQPTLLCLLHRLRIDSDEHSELLIYTLDILQSVATLFVLPPPPIPPEINPIPPLTRIASQSSNRSLIIGAISSLTSILSLGRNASYLAANSPVVNTAIKYLPLINDKPLLESCLNFLYVHLSQPTMGRAFLLDPQMPSTLKLLINVLLSEQVEETVTVPIGGPIHTVPAMKVSTRVHDLTQEELDGLLEYQEPQRGIEWMKLMFVNKPDGEMTQVQFWNLYRQAFQPYTDRCPVPPAGDVIGHVSSIFSQALAMVIPGPPQTFVIRGIDRRKDEFPVEAFKCLWDRSECPSSSFDSAGELFQHVLEEHVKEESGSACLWANCQHHPASTANLRCHVLTHFSGAHLNEKPDSQSDVVTLPAAFYPYPNENPTTRPPPPPPKITYTMRVPRGEAPSASLTALLCIRILFRTSFASTEIAPRVDADHFGFPGLVDDMEDDNAPILTSGASEQEGERKGRRAFVRARSLLEGVHMADDTLMGWITEMVDAGIYGMN